MKRVLIRLTALAAVVVVGLIAIAQAQRAMRGSGPGLDAADASGLVAADHAMRDSTGAREPRMLGARDRASAHQLPPLDDTSDRYSRNDAPSRRSPHAATEAPGLLAAVRSAVPESDTAVAEEYTEPDTGDENGSDEQASERLHGAGETASDMQLEVPVDEGTATEPEHERAGALTEVDQYDPQSASPDEQTGPRMVAYEADERSTNGADRHDRDDAVQKGDNRQLPRLADVASLEESGEAADLNRGDARSDQDSARSSEANFSGEGSGRPGHKHLEGAQTPSLVIEKTGPEEIQVGRPASFRVTVRNTGTVAADGVQIRDEVPKGSRLAETSPEATTGSQGELLWTLGTLEPGAEATAEMMIVPMTEGEIGSVATVHFQADASARSIVTRPELNVELTAEREVMIGEALTLRIKVSNPGSGATAGVMIEEDVPEGLEHPAGQQLEYEIGDLKPGESRELELTLTAAKPGMGVNRIVARGQGDLVAESQHEFEVVAPALAIELSGPARRFLERPATYTLRLLNPGTAPAKGVKLVGHLPAGLEFVKADNYGQFDTATRTVHWLLEELPAGETGEVSFTALPTEVGELKLRLTAAAEGDVSAEKDETVLVEGVAAILFQVADVADPIETGSETTYEVRVVNQGTKAATNLRVVAIAPAEMKPLGAEGPVRHVVDGPRVLFDPLPLLAPKADTTYRVRVEGVRPGDLRFRVELVTDEMQSPVTKEESTQVYSIDSAESEN